MPTNDLDTRPAVTVPVDADFFHLYRLLDGLAADKKITWADLVVAIHSTFPFVTVGASGAQYTTVKAAIDAGATDLFVIDGTTEIANITLPTTNHSITLFKGSQVDMGNFDFFQGADDTVTSISGEGEIRYAHTASGQELFQLNGFSGATIRLSDGLVIRNESTNTLTYFNEGGFDLRVDSTTQHLPNFIGTGFIMSISSSTISNLTIEGGGAACQNALFLTRGSSVRDVLFNGQFATGGLDVIITGSQWLGVSENVTFTNNASVSLTLGGTVKNLNTASGFGANIFFAAGSPVLEKVIIGPGNIDMTGTGNARIRNILGTGGSQIIIPAGSNGHVFTDCQITTAITNNGNDNKFEKGEFPNGGTVEGDRATYLDCDIGGTFTVNVNADDTILSITRFDNPVVDNSTSTIINSCPGA